MNNKAVCPLCYLYHVSLFGCFVTVVQCVIVLTSHTAHTSNSIACYAVAGLRCGCGAPACCDHSSSYSQKEIFPAQHQGLIGGVYSEPERAQEHPSKGFLTLSRHLPAE